MRVEYGIVERLREIRKCQQIQFNPTSSLYFSSFIFECAKINRHRLTRLFDVRIIRRFNFSIANQKLERISRDKVLSRDSISRGIIEKRKKKKDPAGPIIRSRQWWIVRAESRSRNIITRRGKIPCADPGGNGEGGGGGREQIYAKGIS